MKIEGYEEISDGEYIKLPSNKTAVFLNEKNILHYFKEVQKFPIVFEDEWRKIKVCEDRIWFIDKADDEKVYFEENIPLLIEAIEKLKEIKK